TRLETRARPGEFIERFQADLGCPVRHAKIFRFTFLEIRITTAPSHPRGGALASGTKRWDGSRWTLLFSRRLDEGVRRSRVVLAPRCWRQAWWSNLQVTVAKKPAHRGEHDISRKAIAQGMSECFRSPVCSCAPNAQFLAHETAGAACTRHSLRPLVRGGTTRLENSGETCREIAVAWPILTRHPEVRALRCTCTAGRASKDESATGGPSSFEARKSAHLRMTDRSSCRGLLDSPPSRGMT